MSRGDRLGVRGRQTECQEETGCESGVLGRVSVSIFTPDKGSTNTSMFDNGHWTTSLHLNIVTTTSHSSEILNCFDKEPLISYNADNDNEISP